MHVKYHLIKFEKICGIKSLWNIARSLGIPEDTQIEKKLQTLYLLEYYKKT